MSVNELNKKFLHEDWNIIETPLGQYDIKVLNCLKILGDSDLKYNLDHEYKAIGEEKYLENRILLYEKSIVKNNIIVSKNDKKEKSSKKNIILENNNAKISKEITTAINNSITNQIKPISVLKSDILEIKGIGLLLASNYILNNQHIYSKKSEGINVYGVITTIERFINICDKYDCKSMISNDPIKISSTLIKDLKDKFDNLIKIYKYNGYIVHDYFPELLIYTQYDDAIPKNSIKPRKHQVDLMNSIKNNMKNGFMLCYNPPMGSGKTTNVVSIAYYLQKLRFQEEYKGYQLLFVCNLVSVRNQIANLCYNGDIPFGIGSFDNDRRIQIINSFICKKDENRLVIITSPEVAYEILNKDNSKYILFVDEPTIGADEIDNKILQNNMAVLSVAPNKTILSSATFPDIDKLPTIKHYFENKYRQILIDTIYSREIQICCDIQTTDFKHIVPHLHITNKNDLLKTIETIKQTPFLMRIYTVNVLLHLCNKMQNHGIDVMNLKEMMNNIVNLEPNTIISNCLDLLTKLSEYSDEIITDVCSDFVINKKEKKKSDSLWDNDSDIKKINTENLGTSEAYIFQNTTLVVSLDPVDFARKNFKNLLNDIYESEVNGVKYKSTKNILKNYEQQKQLIEKKLSSLKDEQVSIQSKNQNNEQAIYNEATGKMQVMKTKSHNNEKKQGKLDFEIQNEMKEAQILFPLHCEINTREHLERYYDGEINNTMKNNTRQHLNLASIVNVYDDMNVDDDILTLLFAGVGIYTNTGNLCPRYLKTVLHMAENNSLAYLVSDIAISFGINYPINKILVMEDFSNKYSLNTLFQLFGRAGRVGKSWYASIYVSNSVIDEILRYTHNKDDYNIVEIGNMESVFGRYNIDIIHKYTKRLEEILGKLFPEEEIFVEKTKQKVFGTNKNGESKELTFTKKTIFSFTGMKNTTNKMSWRK